MAPVNLGEPVFLHKSSREAKCLIRTHQLRGELRLVVGSQMEIVKTYLCRSEEDVLTTGDQWKAAMIEKGWQ